MWLRIFHSVPLFTLLTSCLDVPETLNTCRAQERYVIVAYVLSVLLRQTTIVLWI
jgi:hypothetical protein